MKQAIILSVKITSIVVTTTSVLLWSAYLADQAGIAQIMTGHFSAGFMSLLWVGRFIVIAHVLEGMGAALIASSQQKPPLRQGVYTFFVGTLGLIELLEDEGVSAVIKNLARREEL